MKTNNPSVCHQFKQHLGKGLRAMTAAVIVSSMAGTMLAAEAQDNADSDVDLSFGVTGLIIELTDNDIELQAFVDGVEWKKLRIFDPMGRTVFQSRVQGRLKRQGGMSEMFWASEPTHYLEDEPNFDGTVDSFLNRFPEGEYEFEGVTANGDEIEGAAMLTHVMAALPEIISPESLTEDPPVVDINALVIEWQPVTTRFIGTGGVDIVEYQVILDQVDPPRDEPWIDGKTRRALINVPGSVSSLTVPREFLLPNTGYEFEVLAIEASGNATIAVGEFITSQ